MLVILVLLVLSVAAYYDVDINLDSDGDGLRYCYVDSFVDEVNISFAVSVLCFMSDITLALTPCLSTRFGWVRLKGYAKV